MNAEFDAQYKITVSLLYKIKNLKSDGKSIKLLIWDTPGRENYRTIISTQILPSSNGIFLVYDITNEQSFERIRDFWVPTCVEAETKAIRFLIGNKCDSKTRVVTTEQGQVLAAKLGVMFMEVSAKQNINISEAIDHMTALMMQESVR